MGTCINTTLIIIDVEHPIDHHRPILHHHRYASPSVCIDTITIDRIIIDVSICGTVGRANGLVLVFSISAAPSLQKLHRGNTIGEVALSEA